MKKYETPVWKARPPMLANYLGDAAKAVGEQLAPVRLVTLIKVSGI